MTTKYTVEVYKTDRRSKKGERLFEKFDTESPKLGTLEVNVAAKYPESRGFRFEIHETFRTVRNAMTGAMVQERYDRPYYMSVASDAYWSN